MNAPTAIPHPSSLRILVRSSNWLGDAVMSTSALQRLREAYATAHITLLSPRKLADLWLQHPSVDATLSFDESESVWQIARRLRAQRLDMALLLPNSPRSALEVFLARIPQRIGYARRWRTMFLTQGIPPRPDHVAMRKRSTRDIRRSLDIPSAAPMVISSAAHHIFQYLHLVAALGAKADPLPPHIAVTEAEVAAVQQRFAVPREKGAGSLLLGLNPGAAYGPAKRWPRDRFVATARALQEKTRCVWWIFGSREEQDLGAGIAAEIGGAAVRCLAGATSLRELCAALKSCDALLTNDSGPMHLAAALGTPVVALFGSTSPELTGPGLPGDSRHRILDSRPPCSPCFLRQCPIDFRCMNQITVEQVVQAVWQVTQSQIENPKSKIRRLPLL
jgi:lipopolysaccharide heptosyltransferase II